MRSEDSVMFFNMSNGSVNAEPFHEMAIPGDLVSVQISPCSASSDPFFTSLFLSDIC